MASAVLASRNEPGWGESREAKVYMRKTPNSNPNPKPSGCPNPNPNLVAGDHGADRNREIHDETPASAAAAVSDDSSTFIRKPPVESGGFVSFNISSYSKKELRELRDRLVAELEQVRSLAGRIEAREIQSSARSIGYSTSDVHAGGREVTSSAGGIPRMYHQPPEILMGKKTKYFSGKPVISPRGPKRAAPESEKALAGMMSKCRQILTKLMKVKGVSSWFNSPVDVVSMGLHDYHTIIKHPMDLGTVRSKLTKGMYNSPLSFAADVRLTFNNALLYNPEGHEVNRVAGQLLKTFEAEFCPAVQRFEEKLADIAREEEAQQMSAWSRIPHIPESLVRAEPMMRAEPVLSSSPPPLPAPIPSLVAPIAHTNEHHHHHQYLQQHNVVRPMMKLAKPKAKDLNKRLMTLEEKERLSEGLQTLPEEKMAQVIQIVRRRNADPVQEGDEIELDLEALDTETLWELDRFLGNCRKLMSKMKRQEAIASVNPPTSSAPPPAQTQSETGDKSPSSKKMKKSDPCDEDVDIGDEMPTTIYPSVVIEKDAGHASSSGSSGSDSSSSSSDSDSDSSSDSDSDREEEEVASLAPGLRPPSPKD